MESKQEQKMPLGIKLIFAWLLVSSLMGLGQYLNWSSAVNGQVYGLAALLPPSDPVVLKFYFAALCKPLALVLIGITFYVKPSFARVWVSSVLILTSALAIALYLAASQAIGFRAIVITLAFVAYIFFAKKPRAYFEQWGR